MTYFQKTLLSNQLALSNGKRLLFEPIGDDEGVIALTDEPLIQELRTLASKQIGGVSEIDEETYQDLKKKAGPNSRKRPSLTDLPQWPQVHLDSRGVQAAAAVEVPVVKTEGVEAVVIPAKPVDPAQNRPQPRKVYKPNVLI